MARSAKYCSFCGRPFDGTVRYVSGPGVAICEDCVRTCGDILRKGASGDASGSTDEEIREIPTPAELKAYLDEYVIGQDAAKRVLSVAVYNHYKRVKYRKEIEDSGVEIDKSNILMIGPTGTGKTLLARTLAKKLDVPFAIADATTLTEAGYVGEDVENILLKLIEAADYDISRAEHGIIFIDEIDKVASRNSTSNSDVSREGVQRDILPIVEGTKVSTKWGVVDTTNILFIAAGAFSFAKPSDLIPELQGRFPLRVELNDLSGEDFYRILTEPQNAITKQYKALLSTEGVEVEFADEALREIADIAYEVNQSNDNIGARRLYTVMEKLLEELAFSADELSGQRIEITKDYVRQRLSGIVENQDLSKYIL